MIPFLLLILIQNAFAQDLSAISEFDRAKNLRQWSLCLKNAKKLSRTNRDLSALLIADALESEARDRLNRKLLAQALQSVAEARRTLVNLYEEFPIYARLAEVDERLARLDLIEAQTRILKKQVDVGIMLWLRSIERVDPKKLILILDLPAISTLMSACSRARNKFCFEKARDLLRIYPSGGLERNLLLASLPQLNKEPEPLPTYSKVNQTYPSKDRDADAAESAMNRYLRGDKDDAAKQFRAFLSNFPKSSQRARIRYWLARYTEEDSSPEEARPLYVEIAREFPFGYYGLLAALRSGTNVFTSIRASMEPVQIEDPTLTVEQKRALQRANALIQAGLGEYARWDLAVAIKYSTLPPEVLVTVAGAYHEAGRFLDAYRSVTELLDRADPAIYSTQGMRFIFSTPFLDDIKTTAIREGVDPLLALSLIKQESAFDRKAISSSGALGLMQLMPFTAVEVDSSVAMFQLSDPSTNIRLGSRYLAGLLRRFSGNIIFSLAAYNAGPERLEQWKKAMGENWSMEEFVESIPFQETRNYVASIMRNYYWYTRLLTGERLTTLDRFWKIPQGSQKNADRM